MPHINDCKLASLKTQTGLDTTISDMLLVYYQNNGATADNIDDAEREFLIAQGATPANENDMWYEFTGILGATGALADRLNYYWCTLGGSLGPLVLIRPEGDGFCTYAPAGTCIATQDYVAVPLNFESAVTSYVWSVESGDAAITAGQGTTTATVQTGAAGGVDADTAFTLKVVASNIDPETADRTRIIQHYHRPLLSISITENNNPGCVYDPETETGCTANASYTASIVGTPTSITWTLSEITGGSASIFSGQGTGSVVVRTTGATDVGYKLTADITSEFQTDSDSGTYSQAHSDGSEPAAAFDALTYDPVTFQMLGVKTGTGDLSVAAGGGSKYAADHLGVYQQFPEGVPVWSGARCVLSAGAGSPVTAAYADNGSGVLLPEVPYLQYYSGATNLITYSNDLANAAWSAGGSPVVTFDQVGLTGAANTATLLSDIYDSTMGQSFRTVTIAGNVASTTTKTWIKKNSNTSFLWIRSILTGGSGTQACSVSMSSNTGANVETQSLGTTAYEVIDAGDWWIVLLEVVGDSATNCKTELYYCYSSTLGGGIDNTFTESIIVGNYEIHEGKSLEAARGLGPIFTTTAAVSTAATEYSWDLANHADNSAYYAEAILSNNTHDGKLLGTNYTTGQIFGSNTGGVIHCQDALSTATQIGSAIDVSMKLGVVHTTDDQKVVNVNNSYGTTIAASSWTTGLGNITYADPSYSAKLRNLQRYDITSYDEGLDIINSLMA